MLMIVLPNEYVVEPHISVVYNLFKEYNWYSPHYMFGSIIGIARQYSEQGVVYGIARYGGIRSVEKHLN